jgi:hypothetical protein
VLLPDLLFARRMDSAGVVAEAVVLAAGVEGVALGFRRVAKMLARPPTTVRGWLRAARAVAERRLGALWAVAAEVAPDAAAVYPAAASRGAGLAALVRVCSALAAAAAARWRQAAAPWWSAAAACRSQFLCVSWWVSRSQHELALGGAWR